MSDLTNDELMEMARQMQAELDELRAERTSGSAGDAAASAAAGGQPLPDGYEPPDASLRGPDGMTDAERLQRTGSVHPVVKVVKADQVPADAIGYEEKATAVLGTAPGLSPTEPAAATSIKDAPEYDEQGRWQSPEQRMVKAIEAANARMNALWRDGER